MRGVTDATVLIYLSRLGKLDWIRRYSGTVFVPGGVFQEVVVQGEALDHPDAMAVKCATESGWLHVKQATEEGKKVDYSSFKGAEAEVLSLAMEKDAVVLSDDRRIRRVAKAMGLDVRGTLWFLFSALERGELSFDEYLQALETLTTSGFRLSGELYTRAVRRGREISRRG